MIKGFTWQDGERTIRFGAGALADVPALLGEGYTLLTTPRAAALAPGVVAAAGAVHEVRPGRVDDLAGDLLGVVGGELLVALGGGRVIDTAKAIAGAGALPGQPRVAAIPTTLSAAEMTFLHRAARGAPSPRFVRPAIVINDPVVCASQPEAELAASAGNALAHAIEGPLTIHSSPVPAAAAQQARALIATGIPEDGPVDVEALALGALLSGYTIDSTHYGLHHVALFHGAARGGLFDRPHYDVAHPGVAPLRPALDADAEQLTRAGVIGDPESCLHLYHRISPISRRRPRRPARAP